MLKDPSTYESLSPQPLGRVHELLIGKHSGCGLIEARLKAKGIAASPELALRILERVKAVKVATNKGPMRAMAARLDEFWSRYLSFSDEDFWSIVVHEMNQMDDRPTAKPEVIRAGKRPPARSRSRVSS
jgi:isopropylmalate/homocitrate/citramalate synthase